jgi:hypothetical protein
MRLYNPDMKAETVQASVVSSTIMFAASGVVNHIYFSSPVAE